jgi:nuclear-control-of-ATPase protein 2
MSLFRQLPPSYAHEELNHSLTALSTIPISIPVSVLGNSETHGPVSPFSQTIERALSDLSTSRPIDRKQLEVVLQSLIDAHEQTRADVNSSSSSSTSSAAGSQQVVTPIDKVREAQIMARAVTVVWKEVLDDLMQGALALEHDLHWWQGVLDSRRDIGLYFIQSE